MIREKLLGPTKNKTKIILKISIINQICKEYIWVTKEDWSYMISNDIFIFLKYSKFITH